jgi:hypothetical protein
VNIHNARTVIDVSQFLLLCLKAMDCTLATSDVLHFKGGKHSDLKSDMNVQSTWI